MTHAEKVVKMWNDDRPIKSIWIHTDGGDEGFSVGSSGVTKIVPYFEDDDSLWFAVYGGETLLQRVNSKYIDVVVYEKVKV